MPRVARTFAPCTLEVELRTSRRVRIAYLFSRYPVVSQTFCDTEILALEKMGVELEIHSIYPPPTSFRHGHSTRMRAPIFYAPPSGILKMGEAAAKKDGRWPTKLIAEQERKYGPEYKIPLRARNALYLGDQFAARGITHFHVHFANRAAHTAVFVKAISGIPFSVSTHGQDFMTDLGNDDLLREICREAEFVANETEFSKGLVAGLCPDSVAKMVRVFNGMDLANFPAVVTTPVNPVPRILGIGRLIEFKGFQHLIPACAVLKSRGVALECEIVGEGPWRAHLQALMEEHALQGVVRLLGSLPQEEVFAKLQAADIFTLPCVVDKKGASDVFPTVILEAMASGKPVVSTRLAGVPEQIEHERTGLLVEPKNEVGLADALERLLGSAELRGQYGDAARKRIEAAFAVEQTVLPLKSLFDKVVPPSAAPERVASGFACLLGNWPGGDRVEAELRQLRTSFPSAPQYVLHASSAAAPDGAGETLRNLEFLPDAMVLEGEWQQERELARQMETWRVDLGQKLSSETFLRHARVALFLRSWLERDRVRHLHVLTASELLVAWMLRRLCGVGVSASIEEESTELPGSVLAKLARDFVGLRAPRRDIAWPRELAKGETSPFISVAKGKRGLPLDSDWLAKLADWSRAPA